MDCVLILFHTRHKLLSDIGTLDRTTSKIVIEKTEEILHQLAFESTARTYGRILLVKLGIARNAWVAKLLFTEEIIGHVHCTFYLHGKMEDINIGCYRFEIQGFFFMCILPLCIISCSYLVLLLREDRNK